MSLRIRRNLAWLALLALLLALAAWLARLAPMDADPSVPGALPAEVRGVPRILDGDTWELGGYRLRIAGLDAPEFRQRCGPPEASWPCGREAIQALRSHLGQRDVHCRLHGYDRYRRALATCFADGENLQRWLVRNGWAVAYGTDGDGRDYTLDEVLAERAGAGIWRDGFTRPGQWRRDRRSP